MPDRADASGQATARSQIRRSSGGYSIGSGDSDVPGTLSAFQLALLGQLGYMPLEDSSSQVQPSQESANTQAAHFGHSTQQNISTFDTNAQILWSHHTGFYGAQFEALADEKAYTDVLDSQDSADSTGQAEIYYISRTAQSGWTHVSTAVPRLSASPGLHLSGFERHTIGQMHTVITTLRLRLFSLGRSLAPNIRARVSWAQMRGTPLSVFPL